MVRRAVYVKVFCLHFGEFLVLCRCCKVCSYCCLKNIQFSCSGGTFSSPPFSHELNRCLWQKWHYPKIFQQRELFILLLYVNLSCTAAVESPMCLPGWWHQTLWTQKNYNNCFWRVICTGDCKLGYPLSSLLTQFRGESSSPQLVLLASFSVWWVFFSDLLPFFPERG